LPYLKTCFIFGLARSGFATAFFLHQNGHPVLVFDDDPAKQQQALAVGLKVGVPATAEEWDLIGSFVLSPGIAQSFPEPHPIVAQAKENGVYPICDIQLFFDLFPKTQAIGITGSNGKSTSCMLISHLLKKRNHPHVVAGNIGVPIFSLECTLFLQEHPKGLCVLELSSYQLELIHRLPLKAAALTNICEHHLHRYSGIKSYIAAKMRIFNHAEKGFLGPTTKINLEAHNKSKHPIQQLPKQSFIPNAPLKTMHDQENFAVTQALLSTLGIDVAMKDCEGFQGLPHRQEIIATHKGITFINDSKATNPQAVIGALQAFSPQIRKDAELLWIAGGSIEQDHLNVYNPFLAHVNKAFLIGSSQVRYAKHLASQNTDFQACDTLENAFLLAIDYAKSFKKATILLSPGCSSFDQFSSFEKRGERFYELTLDFISQEYANAFRI
jgi:UDP-N-acetylmuramoylalanine--D-glutamate ligase